MPRAPDDVEQLSDAASMKTEPFEDQVLSLIPLLRRYSRSLARSDADGEDLLQDCVEKVLVRRAQWRGGSLRSWAFMIMTNLYRDGYRRARLHPPVELTDETAPQPVQEPSEPLLGDPLEKQRLNQAVNALSPDYRAVLMLVAVEGYSYQEVADTLGVPIGTVMSRLSRARRQMAEHLAQSNIVPLRRPK